MGETRVDLLHLLEDLADADRGELEETVLTEIVANALDSGAASIRIHADAGTATLTVIDDGTGMRRADLRRFHDVATSSKQRGEGIGFAGVGIKLGLLLSDEVVTETRRGAKHVATTWALSNRRRAPWRWITPPGALSEQGTAVRLRLTNPLSPLLDAVYVEATLRRHFEPLFDPYFAEILRRHYPGGVRFFVNGLELSHLRADGGDGGDRGPVMPLELRMPRKRTPSAYGYIMRAAQPVVEERSGIAISTYGKVIKRGWDWLGVTPAAGDRVSGMIEAPALAAALTLNKADFVRAGPRGALYLSYRKALQEAVMAQLAAWGDVPDEENRGSRRAARPVERDLEAILIELAGEFPMLEALVEKRAGGKRKLPVAAGGNGRAGAGGEFVTDLFASPREEPAPTAQPERSEPSVSERGTGVIGGAEPETLPPVVSAELERDGRGQRRERKPA